MDTLRRDLRFALRTLFRSPGWTAATVATLALGIGATTAIFSVVHGVLLRPLPYPEPERIVQVWELNENGGRMSFADPNFSDLREQSRSFAALAQLGGGGTVSVSGDVEPLRAASGVVSADFAAAVGVQPVIGRWFLPEEQHEGASPAVIVSHRFWRDQLGGVGDPSTKTLRFGNRAHRVVGVMPPAFDFPEGVDLFTPRELERVLPSRTAHNWRVIGRLRDGVTLAQARAEVTAISRRLNQEHGESIDLVDASLTPLREQMVGDVRPALLVLLGSAGVLLLIACANVTNLLLARAASRQRELAVRVAMGAGRGRLMQQFLAESLVLAVAGGIIGIVVAVAGVRVLLSLEPGNLPRVGEIGVSWTVLAFAFSVTLVTAAILGLTTALRGTSGEVREALAQSQRTSTGAGSHRVRSGLVVAQVAATLVLLVGAGLLGRSFLRLVTVDPGYRTEDAVVLDISTPTARTPEEYAQRVRLYDDLLARLRSIPGVTQVGGINALPLRGGSGSGTFLVLAHPDEQIDFSNMEALMQDDSRTGYAQFRIASEGYFEAMDIPLVRGRLFDERDAPDAQHVAVISETLAETEWPAEDPIGKYIQFGNMDGDLTPFMIVGVVGDIREFRLDGEPGGVFYGYHRQRPRAASRFNVVMQGALDASAVVPSARLMLRELAPEIPPRFQAIEEVVATSVASRRFSLVLLGVFAITALLLAMLGVYSVISVLVAQREQEMGIRVALGAQARDVVGLVLRHGTVLTIVGVVVGVAASLALTRLLTGLLYDVSATDPLSFAGVSALLILVAVVASWVPARRATRVDPMTVLRNS